MLKSTIVDTRVRLRPSKKLLDFLGEQKEHLKELPANLAKILEKNGYSIANSTKIIRDDEVVCKRPQIDVKLLNKLTANLPDVPSNVQETNELPEEEEEEEQKKPLTGDFLYLNDLHILNSILIELRKKNITNVFLYELIESCELILPENEYKPRNPELEARCQRLRDEQQNREYHKMTKNVDATLKHIPEDTVAYQLKSINKQIIAVAQFIFSVAAGFTFGFFGVNLMVGPLPFGFRILLGVIVALVIALAEMYFLAKKLHEYDEVLDAPKRKAPNSPKASGVQILQKPHVD
ncbi:uncharacterized protein LOC108649013 [Drosophila navojoa]|uniref:uncharacterized protein LOC108649013 n=1 Tax=Drosophila navojoa TaxID=7232 RepID=UPI0011BDF9DF|nr:uncharacterized protein LOC108649013 [Drosophila navojoa]